MFHKLRSARVSRGRMRIVLAWLLLAVGLATVVPETISPADAAPAQPAPPSYSNWLFNGDNPFIMRTGTAQAPVYYAYVSGFDFGFPIGSRAFRSTDLAQWEDLGIVLPVATAGAWADRSSGWKFSSPSVREIGTNPAAERYVMYFTGIQASTGSKCIGVATSSSPAGPFVGRDTPLICPTGGAQDPSAVVLPDGLGFQEVVYSRVGGANAGIYNQVLTQDGLALHAGWNPLLLYKPMANWWHEGVVDRPSLVGDGQGNAYLFFSAGQPNTTGRAVGWSPCTHLGIVTNCQNQTMLGTWFGGSAQVKAPGGVQPFTDAQGNNWITYRGLDPSGCSGSSCNGTPSVYLDRLCFSHAHPRTNAPTTGSQSTGRNATCSLDIPPPASVSVASVADNGSMLGTPTAPLNLDGLASAAAGGKVLWTFGDTFGCPGGHFSTSAGFGVPNAAAETPNYVQHNCAEFVPRTPDEVAYDNTHNVPCTPPAGGTCEMSRIIMWGMVTGLPDGSGLSFFSKSVNRNTRSWGTDPHGNPVIVDSGWDKSTPLGVGMMRVTAASIAAGNPVGDRSQAVSPLACNPTSGGGATAAGCLFNESADPNPGSNSDRFWRPYVEGGFLYLFSDWSWEGFETVGNTKLARVLIADMNTASAWRYWKGPGPDDWATTYAQAADVPGMMAGGIHYNPYLDKYVNTWSDWGFWIDIQMSDSLTGPWTPRQRVYDLVVCPQSVSYAAGFHPELASDNGRTLPMAYFAGQHNDFPCTDDGARYAEVRLG